MKTIDFKGKNIEVEDWVNYIASDKYGTVWFESQPELNQGMWCRVIGRMNSYNSYATNPLIKKVG